MILLGISRNLFTHSLPLVVAEQCYMKLLKDARCLVQDTKIAAKREKAYTMLLNLIEDFNVRLLSTKVYWDRPNDREQFKRFFDKYKDIEKLKENPGLAIYNLGTGHGYSVLDIVKNFEAASGVKIPYVIKPRRAGDIATCYCDAGKAERELHWKATRDLKTMCADSWRWQQNNPNGYED